MSALELSTADWQVLEWTALDANARRAALARPESSSSETLRAAVGRILEQVRADGDAALRALTRRYDRCELARFEVTPEEFEFAEQRLDPALRRAIEEAKSRIDAFHRATVPQALRIQTAPGVVCERVLRPIGRVGLYVPAGTAPLPSTALMLGVPAQIAQCSEVVLCTPARGDSGCDPAVLYAALLCGITCVIKLGGAQAIAAMAFGTGSVPKCDKLFGPGNVWVTEAKRQVALATDGAAIDLLAGPSELLVVADGDADPEFIAADLLAQAEHGPDSQVLLIADDRPVLDATLRALHGQLAQLPRRDIATAALVHARFILAASLDHAIAISNDYAPEHLILNVHEPRTWLEKVENAGSIFLGPWSPEAVGDYCSGTNHVLPTGGHARAYSGVSVTSFLKQITVQELTPDGLRTIGPYAMTLARAERLDAHARAVSVRLGKVET